MSDPRDRLIAERMGWRMCKTHGTMMMPDYRCKGPEFGHPHKVPTMADPADREAVIAWLNAQGAIVQTIAWDFGKGYTVEIFLGEDAYKAKSLLKDDGPDYKAEAFRAAVLAATEGKEQ